MRRLTNRLSSLTRRLASSSRAAAVTARRSGAGASSGLLLRPRASALQHISRLSRSLTSAPARSLTTATASGNSNNNNSGGSGQQHSARFGSAGATVAGLLVAAAASASAFYGHALAQEKVDDPVLKGEKKAAYDAYISALPVEKATLTFAPHVPPPITRDYEALVKVDLTTELTVQNLTNKHKYEFWTFNKHCPGPFLRCRQGDTLEIALTNNDEHQMPHNIDLHGVNGPGGGAAITLAETGKTKTARFKMFSPGLYVYHCAAAPVPMHIANGMYGLLLVEPESPLPAVDREYYVMQSEFYTQEVDADASDPAASPDGKKLEFSYARGLREHSDIVVFNGREGALTDGKPLTAKSGERVRIYFGNGGPNLTSAFHVIGCIFDKVYRDGDLYSPPARFIQTIPVPPGGAAVVEFTPHTPGTYTLVDHALFRMDKGAVGFLSVAGEPRPDVYHSSEGPLPCVGCKLHP